MNAVTRDTKLKSLLSEDLTQQLCFRLGCMYTSYSSQPYLSALFSYYGDEVKCLNTLVFVRTSQNMTVGFLHIPLSCLPAVTKVQGSERGKLLMCMHLLSLKESSSFLQ